MTRYPSKFEIKVRFVGMSRTGRRTDSDSPSGPYLDSRNSRAGFTVPLCLEAVMLTTVSMLLYASKAEMSTA